MSERAPTQNNETYDAHAAAEAALRAAEIAEHGNTYWRKRGKSNQVIDTDDLTYAQADSTSRFGGDFHDVTTPDTSMSFRSPSWGGPDERMTGKSTRAEDTGNYKGAAVRLPKQGDAEFAFTGESEQQVAVIRTDEQGNTVYRGTLKGPNALKTSEILARRGLRDIAARAIEHTANTKEEAA